MTLTNKIRIAGYDTFEDNFKITFQQVEFGDQFRFNASFDRHSSIALSDATKYAMSALGLEEIDFDFCVDAIQYWIEKPRKSLNGRSHGDALRSDFNVQHLEKERRGKAEAARIIVAAPCLDFAMSALDELETDDAAEKLKEFHDKGGRWIVPERGTLVAAIEEQTKRSTLGFSQTPAQEDEFRKLIGWPPLSERDQATWRKIATSEASGFGEEANSISSEPDLDDLLDKFDDASDRVRRLSEWHERETHPDYKEACEGQDAARQAIHDHVEVLKQAPVPEGIMSRERAAVLMGIPSLPTEAIGKAVNTIHTHVRRFMKPASLREHDFLRSIIQEEIEKVIGGVL